MTKYERVAGQIRRDIVEGRLPCDEKLPPRRHFQETFGVSSITVQKAFDVLAGEGFVTSPDHTGTFVVPHPPHRYRIGIVFHFSREQVQSYKFSSRIIDQAGVIAEKTPYEFEIYHGVGGKGDEGGETARLLDDVEAGRLGGIIGGSKLDDWVEGFSGWPIWRRAAIPRIMIQSVVTHPEFPAIYPDLEAFLGSALDVLVERGVEQIGMVGWVGLQDSTGEAMEAQLRTRGLSIPPFWRLSVKPCCYDGVKNSVHLMMRSEDRPDGLIVTDDNLLDHVGAGILAAGVRVPEEVTVVSEANFPVPRRSIIPAVHVGFDVRRLLRRSLQCMERQRETGRFDPQQIKIPPQVAECRSGTFISQEA